MKSIGLIGLGKQGLEHLGVQHLCRHARITSVFDPSANTNQLPDGILACTSVMQLLNQPIDAVILAIPHQHYLECIKEVWRIRPGMAIAKEKPLGRNVGEANRLLGLAKEQQAHLRTLIQRRHHPTYKRLKQLMNEQPNAPELINLTLNLGFDRPIGEKQTNWRTSRKQAGGGALLDCGYHLVDLALYLVGDFEVVGCTLWHQHQLLLGDQVDDKAHLVGVSNDTWLNVRSSVYNDDFQGARNLMKFEQVEVHYPDGILVADRQELRVFNADHPKGVLVFTSSKDWQQALVDLIDDFAISLNQPQQQDQDLVWDQQPAQSIIAQGYAMANLWATTYE